MNERIGNEHSVWYHQRNSTLKRGGLLSSKVSTGKYSLEIASQNQHLSISCLDLTDNLNSDRNPEAEALAPAPAMPPPPLAWGLTLTQDDAV